MIATAKDSAPDPRLLLDNFVLPRLCSPLHEAGLAGNGWYTWRKYTPEEEFSLYQIGMDPYGVMATDLGLPAGVTAAPFIEVPAYTLSDLLRVLPGYFLEYEYMQWVRRPERFRKMVLQDMLAKAIYEGLRCKQIFIEDANAALTMQKA